MNLKSLTLTKLNSHHNITQFDCGDVDLNGFLLNDAVNYLNELMSITYTIEYNHQVVAYFCLLNDKVTFDTSNVYNKKFWNRFNRLNQIPNPKRRKGYPAVKIGRLAVSNLFKGQHIGQFVLESIQSLILSKMDIACRFITVDAYQSAFDFYLKNDFNYLSSEDEGESTRLMYFDLKNILLAK
jgi:predicted GNAT family N-acyltransferase